MLSGYYFFLGYLPLPITPAALSIQTPSMNKTLTLVNEGEINLPKKAGLREISFDFLLPQVTKYPFSHYQIDKYTATLWMEYIKLWKELNWPFQFIVVRLTPKGGLTGILGFTCIKCVIEDFTFDEDADSLGLDIQCSIKLKEYRDYGTKRITLEEAREKYGETYMSGQSVSTQSGVSQGGSSESGSSKTGSTQTKPKQASQTKPKQATVTKTRTANKVVQSKTEVQTGETLATATKRETGVTPSAESVVAATSTETSPLTPPKSGETVEVLIASTGKYVDLPKEQIKVVERSASAQWAHDFKRHWSNQWSAVGGWLEKSSQVAGSEIGKFIPSWFRQLHGQ